MSPLQRAWGIEQAAPALKLIVVGLAMLQEDSMDSGGDGWIALHEITRLVKIMNEGVVAQRLRMAEVFGLVETAVFNKWTRYRVKENA